MGKVMVLMEVANKLNDLYDRLTDDEKEQIKGVLRRLSNKIKDHLSNSHKLSDEAIDKLVDEVDRQTEDLMNQAVTENRNEQSENTSYQMESMINNPEESEERMNRLEYDSGIDTETERTFMQKVENICERVVDAYRRTLKVLDSDSIMEALQKIKYSIEQSKEEIQDNHISLSQKMKDAISKEINEARQQLEANSQEKENVDKDKDLFSDLQAGVKSDEDSLKTYSEQEGKEAPEQPDLSQGDWIV